MARVPDQPRLLEELPAAVPAAGPTRLSVTGLVAYARCPRQCYWSVVEPLPRTGSPSARLGSLIHGWIERRAAGQGSLLDDAPDPGEDPRGARLRAAFVDSPYGGLVPRHVERAFALDAGGVVVRGRVDAIYERDGRIEVVDFKTGRLPAADDRGAGVQLDLYALAAVDCFGADPDAVRTTEWYLARGTGTSRDFDARGVERVREALARRLAGWTSGRFEPVAGSYCSRCDFADRCRAGQAYLAGR